MNKYWPTQAYVDMPYLLEARANFAAQLIERFGLVAGRDDGEDSVGRRALKLLDPQEVVDRAFAISNAFFDRAEADGGIVARAPIEERMVEIGRVEGIKNDAIYGRLKPRKVAEEKETA